MNNLTEIITSMIILIAGTKIAEKYEPSQMELHLSNGHVTYIEINKKNYSCPKSCSIQHFHKTIISKNDLENSNYTILYKTQNNEKFLELNNINIDQAFEIKEKKKKRKKDSYIIKKKVDINSFLEIYN